MTTAWQHPVRAKLEAGESVLGITITVPNIESAAVAATLGFDFLWVEMEHSPITLETRPASSPEQVQAFQQQGFRFFQSQTELGLLRLGAKALGLKPAEVGALY
jgi:hypothetical protein